MSYGKYSPTLIKKGPHIYNAYGKIPEDYDHTIDKFDEKIHLANYDEDGYDRYGYSAFHADGSYAGIGDGIDRDGYTENEYLREYTENYDDECY